MNPDLSAAQPNAIGASVGWIEQVLTGNLAATVAIVVVVAFGFMLISGRLSTRRGAQLILGCFVLFGASSIAAGLRHLMSADANAQLAPMPDSEPPLPVTPSRTTPMQYDPYAGAALPPRR